VTRQRARTLLRTAAGIAVVAIVLQALPLSVRLPSVPADETAAAAPTVDPSAQAAALLTYEGIARTDPFDRSRQPPAERYVPPALQAAQQPVRPANTPVAPRLQLFGVATGPSGAVALIDANPAIPGAEIYRIGDRVSVYELESISDTMVVLRGSSGVRRLRLQSLSGRSQ
jgi:hypothetical protein